MNASTTRKKVQALFNAPQAADPEHLLQAGMGSFYPDSGTSSRVRIRFIELMANKRAKITVRVGNDFYSATVSREAAIQSSDLYDIVVENGEFRHIRQKVISATGTATRLVTEACPSDVLEGGEQNELALYAPKGTVIDLGLTLETVQQRVLYHPKNGSNKFMIQIGTDRWLEHVIPAGSGPFGVPGDFEVFEDSGYISLITQRVMTGPNNIRDDATPVVLPE